MLLTSTPVWADPLDLTDDFADGVFNMDTGASNNPIEIGGDDLPAAGEAFILNSSAFASSVSNIAGQDENSSVGRLVWVPDRSMYPNGQLIEIRDQAGDKVYDNSSEQNRFRIDESDAELYYKLTLNYQGGANNGLDYIIERQLTRINLKEDQNSPYGLVVNGGSADGNSAEYEDLSVAITGKGDIQFAFTEQQGGGVDMF